jgi:hypothetical protein
LEDTSMRTFILTGLITGAVLASAVAPASAADQRWTDVQFLRANRCLGLAQSEPLGAIEATGLIARIKAETRGRDIAIADRGVSLRADALRAGRTRDEARKAALLAERDGGCKAYLAG